MKSIKAKLVLMYLVLVFIVMMISGTFMIVNIRVQELERLETELLDFSNLAAGEIFGAEEDDDSEYVLQLANLIKTNGNRITADILSADGYNIDQEKAGTVYTSPAIAGAMLGKPTLGANKWGVRNQSFVDYALPYPYSANLTQDVRYIIYASVSTKPVQDRLIAVTMAVVVSVFLALTLAAVIGLLFANTLTGPIITLTKRAKEWSNGNLERQIEVKSKDEIGQLTRTFNEISRELSYTLRRITTEKNKMEILLYNMIEGVLAYDNNGILIEANYSAHEQLGIKNIRVLTLKELLDSLHIDIDTVTDINELKENTVQIGDKYINVISSPYYGSANSIEGVVLVLQDITKHKKLDDMRKEFVANVSHEIRTPLTTIKTYTETLLDGALFDTDTAENFLTVIDKETDRMTLLATDLLILSRFDNQQFDFKMAEVDLDEIIQRSIFQVELLAHKKRQTIEYKPPETKLFIVADSSRIEQVFVNILSNAVKYSNDNTEISVTVSVSERYYRVYVRDQGFGIPKEDLPRIFERFYRVDKARSREMGGTGLGLSIAKEIMEAHNFRISASSEVGAGTAMILRFNRNGLIV
ncbi:PAS domain-containing sensor histidine kinase [Clostridia bacterium]|nr:PAS domain-containing sensor histidine kinase [Clostridia bacterium]